ncbi:MAG: JAB domain-containing protein [Bacteroidales bacterium]|nr:JAB domain-containing protein [Bacteroidales bacterium]
MKEYLSHIPEITLKLKTGDIRKVQIKSSQDAADYLRLMYDEDTLEVSESVVVVYMNRSNNSIGWFKVSQGGISGSVIDVRLILATALKCLSSGMIICHNHPSGNTQPSDADVRITQKLKEAGSLMDIQLLDHIILTPEGSHYSFADEGKL